MFNLSALTISGHLRPFSKQYSNTLFQHYVNQVLSQDYELEAACLF